MGDNFRPYALDQLYLIPPSISDWASEESLAGFMGDVIDPLDRAGKLASFYEQYRDDGGGKAPYHPWMMVKILVYGYCIGVSGSRRMAQALENDVTFRSLSAAHHDAEQSRIIAHRRTPRCHGLCP